MIYEHLESRRKDEHIVVYLSYLEIYQEVAYDLLSVNAVRTNMSLAPFAKVWTCSDIVLGICVYVQCHYFLKSIENSF